MIFIQFSYLQNEAFLTKNEKRNNNQAKQKNTSKKKFHVYRYKIIKKPLEL